MKSFSLFLFSCSAAQTLASFLDNATVSIDVHQQYIYAYSSSFGWLDSNGNVNGPLSARLVYAAQNGVTVRIIVDSTDDTEQTYPAGPFFQSIPNISVRYINTTLYNHNKGVVIDAYTPNAAVSVASVNWSKTSLTANREAGTIVYDAAIANYFAAIFDYDFSQGTIPAAVSAGTVTTTSPTPVAAPTKSYPRLTGYMTITAFTNPDNAYCSQLLLPMFASINRTLHGEMYQITANDLPAAIVTSLTNNPSIDVTLIVTSAMDGSATSTTDNEQLLYNNGASIFASSSTFTYTHMKTWTYDGRYTVVFSGNWADTSITYQGYDYQPNREFGLLFDSTCVSAFWENVYLADRLIATDFATPQKCTNYDSCDVCNGDNLFCVTAPVFESNGCCSTDTNAESVVRST